ncbi:MAG: hypothetical protein Q4D96_10690 [Propionibacteriaceae bacterium]|nr:hypothetical protein [Propionibacteriaceae bacterium]
MRRGWLQGRVPWLAVLAWVAAVATCYGYWWVALNGPWAEQYGDRLAAVGELVPVLLGAVALYAMTPRLDWIDAQSPRPIRLIDAVGAAVTILAFAAAPLLARVLWEVGDFYVTFVPPEWTLADPSLRAEVAPWPLFVLFGCTIAVVLSATLLGIALLGPVLGAASVLLWLFLLLLAQAQGGLDLIDPTAEATQLGWPGVALVLASLGACLASYRWSASGHRPAVVVVIDRLSHR